MKQDFGSIEYKPLYLYMSLTHISKPFYSLILPATSLLAHFPDLMMSMSMSMSMLILR